MSEDKRPTKRYDEGKIAAWHAHATQRAARGHEPVWITHATGPSGTVTKIRQKLKLNAEYLVPS